MKPVTRFLRVYYQPSQSHSESPRILIQGQYLKKAGWLVGDPIVVTITEEKILIKRKENSK